MSPCGSLRKHIVWGSSTKSKSSWPCGQKSINPIDYALRVTAEGGMIYKIYKILRCRRRAGVSWVYGTRYKSKILALRAEIYKSYRLCASRNRRRRNNLQDLQDFASPEASGRITDFINQDSWPFGQKSINPIDYALRVTAEGGIIYKIYKISRCRRRAGESWVYGTRYKSKLLALRAEIYKSCKLYASRLLHQPKSECCRNRRIPNEKPSDIRQIQSSPVAEYWIETTENRKSDSILIFIVSIIYDFYPF